MRMHSDLQTSDIHHGRQSYQPGLSLWQVLHIPFLPVKLIPSSGFNSMSTAQPHRHLPSLLLAVDSSICLLGICVILAISTRGQRLDPPTLYNLQDSYNPLDPSKELFKACVVRQYCKSSTLEVEEGGSGVPGQSVQPNTILSNKFCFLFF